MIKSIGVINRISLCCKNRFVCYLIFFKYYASFEILKLMHVLRFYIAIKNNNEFYAFSIFIYFGKKRRRRKERKEIRRKTTTKL